MVERRQSPQLRLLRPPVIVPVGQLAIRRFLGPGSLEDRVGKTFGDNPLYVPLPHPSGQSRWLNDPANRERLATALALIADLRARFATKPLAARSRKRVAHKS